MWHNHPPARTHTFARSKRHTASSLADLVIVFATATPLARLLRNPLIALLMNAPCALPTALPTDARARPVAGPREYTTGDDDE